MVIEWQGFAAEPGRPQPSRQTLSRHIQATETGWPCSTGFTNSFRRLGGSLAHVLELVAERRGGGGLMRPGTGGRSADVRQRAAAGGERLPLRPLISIRRRSLAAKRSR